MRDKACLMKIILIGLLVSVNCLGQDSPLGKYMKQYKYTLLIPPSQNAAVATVINFDAGFESIVSSKCISVAKVPPNGPTPIALSTNVSSITRHLSVAGAFTRFTHPAVDLKGAFDDSRVQAISIEMIEPTETHIEIKDLKDYIASLPSTDSCRSVMMNKHNLVRESVISVKGINYYFYDNKGNKMSLDATLTKAIKLSPQYQKSFENTDHLKIDGLMVIAYRAWRGTQLPGGAGTKGGAETQVAVETVTPEQIARLRRQARQTQPVLANAPTVTKPD